jgi:hypothetical protein
VFVLPKDIFRNKRDFARAEFATELYKPEGRPRPREAKSQQGQYDTHYHGGQKERKRPMNNKLGNASER